MDPWCARSGLLPPCNYMMPNGQHWLLASQLWCTADVAHQNGVGCDAGLVALWPTMIGSWQEMACFGMWS